MCGSAIGGSGDLRVDVKVSDTGKGLPRRGGKKRSYGAETGKRGVGGAGGDAGQEGDVERREVGGSGVGVGGGHDGAHAGLLRQELVEMSVTLIALIQV